MTAIAAASPVLLTSPTGGRFDSVSIVVPTFREAENIPELLARLDAVRQRECLDLELILVDDDSQDESAERVADFGADWVRLIVRRNERGLSSAVLHGCRQANNDVILVMDADLSHPPEKIPQMLQALRDGADFVIGSRYVPGGSTDAAWGFPRWLNSKAATLLARPFTSAADPMAGFFACRRDRFLATTDYNPIGYKIGLEFLVKCGCRDVREVPIHFADRKHGQSKLNLGEQLRYIQHLRRLVIFKYPALSAMGQFAVVGASGTVVNLVVVTLFHGLGVFQQLSLAAGIGISLFTNYLLNRRFTFSHARHGGFWRQFAGFAAACSLGVAVNYAVAITIIARCPGWPVQAAALLGILSGLLLNFVFSKWVVFGRGPSLKLKDRVEA